MELLHTPKIDWLAPCCDVEAFVLDYDGVWYDLDDKIDNQVVQRARDLTCQYLDVTQEEAKQLTQSSWQKYNSSYDFLFNDKGISRNEILDEMHNGIDTSSIVPASPELLYLMAKCQPDVKFHILSHGTRPWIHDRNKEIGITHLFNDNNMTTIEDLPPLKKKNNSTYPFELVRDKTGIDLKKSIMFEDSQGNLKHAKQAGMQTVMINPGKNFQKQSCTDHVVPRLVHFMRAFNANRYGVTQPSYTLNPAIAMNKPLFKLAVSG